MDGPYPSKVKVRCFMSYSHNKLSEFIEQFIDAENKCPALNVGFHILDIKYSTCALCGPEDGGAICYSALISYIPADGKIAPKIPTQEEIMAEANEMLDELIEIAGGKK